VTRDPGVLTGDKERYEIRWPENRMYYAVMRKNIRLGDLRPGCTYW